MSNIPIQAAYTQWAATYDTDRNLTRDLDQHVTRRMLEHRRYVSILEIGCGTGKNTRLFAGLGEQVHAIDFSEGMLAQAREKGLGVHVTFAQADLTQRWPCADACADLVSCNLVLEHIADIGWVFREAARCLVPSGRFFVSELHPFKQYLGSKAVFQREEERIEVPAFVHHVSDFLDAARRAGLKLDRLDEWWHDEDRDAPPRLVTFVFER
jgi:ubiquinone/menaquinone biosynthesis C-methylase UbiE